MASAFQEYHIQLINKRTGSPIDDDAGKYIVMQAGTSTLQTVYTDDTGTTPDFVYTNVTQTMTNGEIRFWTASGTQTVDVSVVTEAGQSVFIEALTTSQHRIEIDTEKHEQTMIFPFYNYIPTPFTSASITMTGSIWSPGLSIPAGALVKDCLCRVETLGTTADLDIGVSGTPSGLLQTITAAVTGLKWPVEPSISGGTAVFAKGTSFIASTSGFVKNPWFTTTATALVFGGNVTVTTLAAMVGYVYVTYDLLPNRV